MKVSVPPPACVADEPFVAAASDTGTGQPFHFDRLGVRVPAILISPWIPKGTVVSGRNFEFEEAKDLGLVNDVFPAETFWQDVIAYARSLRAAFEGRLREFPNGATAMRAMADAGDPAAVGCTQESEIRYTQGVSFVARLPAPYELSTGYAAGVPVAAPDPDAARRFVAALTGAATRDRRSQAGFEVVPL